MDKGYSKQLRVVCTIYLVGILVLGLLGFSFWKYNCGESWASCLGSKSVAPIWFLFFSVLRPFLLTPAMVMAWMGGDAFGPYLGSIIISAGATLSCLIIYLPTKYLGKFYIKPWMAANLPAFWEFLSQHDYKVVFITRWIPLIPFDILSFIYGFLNFRIKSVIIWTFIGHLPSAFMFARLTGNLSTGVFFSTMYSLMVFAILSLIPYLIFEIASRKQGRSLWTLIKAVYREILFEIRANNETVKRFSYSPDKPTVLLLYGFFSSRRTLITMERLLEARGFQVMIFNLGGLFNTFFTKDIPESAMELDKKIRRQVERYNIKKLHVVAHSKGGLVALWWLFSLGGEKYCDKLVTMATPFRGSPYALAAILTPLGFIWRDIWQMRPGSEFLKEITAIEIPEHMKVYCLNSPSDKVVPGDRAVFKPKRPSPCIEPIRVEDMDHFDFLYRREVADLVAGLLRGDEDNKPIVK